MMTLGLILAGIGAVGLALFAWDALGEIQIGDNEIARLYGEIWKAQDAVAWWRDAAQAVNPEPAQKPAQGFQGRCQ